MNVKTRFEIVALVLISAWIVTAQPRLIDLQKSAMTVRVSKAGILSALGHDHEIVASIAAGTVDVTNRRVELRCSAAALRVHDPDASDKDREEIQKTMLGPAVLDVDRYPRIVFQSSAVEPAGAGSWTITGELSLHGQTRPIAVQVHERNGHYIGTARLKQSEFGIKPVKVAGGTIRVKDEVRIEFDVQLAQSTNTHGLAGK
ncbi:MAG TPA: YceI family protein [Bryobacteraceae bacterium]|jgi:polyisoprenoid-binding protein YceI